MEGNPKNYNEGAFIKDWEGRVNDWIREIRTSGIPDEYAEELEIPITEVFLKKYLRDLGRDKKEIHMFLEDFGNHLDKIPPEFQTQKDTIEKIVEDDIETLLKIDQN